MSVLLIMSEVFGLVGFERLYSIMQVNKFFYCRQFESGSKISTLHAIMGITELIWSNTNLEVTCVPLDLRKAFDTMNPEFLSVKWKSYSVRIVWSLFRMVQVVSH